MKKLLTLSAVVLAATLGLTGCTNPFLPPTPAPAPAPATPAPAPEAPVEPQPAPVQPETLPPVDPGAGHNAFQDVMADRFGTDQETLNNISQFAINFCAELEEYTYASLFERYVTEADTDPGALTGEDMGYILGAAVPAYCPKWQAEADAYLNG